MGFGKIAEVGVENSAYGFDKLFSYSIPDGLADAVLPGCRVCVAFGRGNAMRQAFVFRVREARDEDALCKPVLSVLDREPVLGEELTGLALWLREHTFCTCFEAVKTMLPKGLCMKTVRCYRLCDDAQIPWDALADDERTVLTLLSKAKEPVQEKQLLKALGLQADKGLFSGLVKKGWIATNRDILPGSGEKSVSLLRPADETAEAAAFGLSRKQASVYKLLCDAGAATVKELCYYTGASASVVTALVKKGAAEVFQLAVDRSVSAGYGDRLDNAEPVRLSRGQSEALQRLCAAYRDERSRTALLFGVTGSGKTAVYLALIEQVLADGKNVLVMVPEIALTPQTLSVFSARFGALTAVFHSGLSVGERHDEWMRVKNGEARIVVGTRSAVFAPLENIGLVVMDEEQAHTYKSEMSPRYHARDVAKYRCAYHRALLLLTSATPSVETYANAQNGRYLLCELRDRFGKAVLPTVTTVDMTDKALCAPHQLLSGPLASEIERNLEDGKQTMLLMNRRGYNTFVVCSSCKAVMTCPSCSISMTYHTANNRLLCHYCGYSVPYTDTCPSCAEKNIRYAGFGTQRLEEELRSRFPTARVLRLDADTVTAKNTYERTLGAFAAGEYDILLGTQMIAKGLDFPAVTLVGVVSVDQQLYNDDYRSPENVFDLLTQVIGRAGRARAPGRAVIQTLVPDNGILHLAARQDYVRFYEDEIAIRRAMIYPPFCDLCMLGFTGEREEAVQAAATAFLRELIRQNDAAQERQKIIVLGPLPPRIARMNGKYRQKLLVKCRNSGAFRAFIARLLKDFLNKKEYKDINVFADMNPVSAF